MPKKAEKQEFAELRKRALEMLDSHNKTDPEMFNGNIRKLIVELDTNRIERELQNEDLRSAQAELEDSHQKYNQLYEFAPVGYLTLDRVGRVVEANLRAAELLKVDRIALVDQKFSTFVDFYDQDIFHLHLQNLKVSGVRQSCQLALRRGDGSRLQVQLASVIKSGHKDVLGPALMTMTDITELDVAKREISTLNAELEIRVQKRTLELEQTKSQLLHKEKLVAIGTLAASIAHELNNPLQGVLNVINGISRRATLDPEDAELLDIAIGECKRMRDLLKALQDFNRPTSGIRAPLDVHDMIDSVLLLFRKTFALKNIILERHYADNIPVLYGVADQLKQVVMNLLSNSIRACEGGGVISIRTEMEQTFIVIAFRDNGIGIEPEIMDRIFEPFFSTKPEVKGIGLGLSISHGIIKEHNGTIEVESEPGKGTSFRIKLPIRSAERNQSKSNG